MKGTRYLPANERPGKYAWLGPLSLALAVLSWLIPPAGPLLGLAAVACGAVSVSARTEYRLDWTAVAGLGVGAVQLFFSVVVLAMDAAGR